MKKKKKSSSIHKIALSALVAIFVISGIIYHQNYGRYTESSLELESRYILASLVQDDKIAFIQDDVISEDMLKRLTQENGYEMIKDSAGVEHDFCIYFEDESGNILDLDGQIADSASDVTSIGNAKLPDAENLNIKGTPCGAKRI